MLLQIPDVLAADQIEQARQWLDEAAWVDGRGAREHHPGARDWILPESDAVARRLGEVCLEALQRNTLFLSAALPLRVFPPLFQRDEGGAAHGNQIDMAIRQSLQSGLRIRTDLSAMLFLTEPEEYDGGELLVEDTYGVHSVKLPAGHMVLYPASSLHNVQPVTRGGRLVARLWIQSMLRDDGQRTLLFDLDTAIQRLTLDSPQHPAAAQLGAVYHNLLRRWAEL